MPNILHLEREQWELVIWTRNNDKPLELLSSVLKERDKVLSNENICLSFPLGPNDSCTFNESPLKIEPHQSSLEIKKPLCFENRDYEFEFTFKNNFLPDQEKPILHRLNEIENSFRSVGNSVRGVVNFGNNIGWFKFGIQYNKHGKSYRDDLSFKVFPTKMDMESDLDVICNDIDSVYPLWRFTIAEKTDTNSARSKTPHQNFELLWLAQFKSLARELTKAGRLICNSPHSRLLSYSQNVKAEKIGSKLKGKLEERVKENISNLEVDRHYRIEKKKLSYDTPENRFVKKVILYSVNRMALFRKRAKELNKLPERTRLSESFFNELNEMIAPFEALASEPLFREVGKHNGNLRESLVLHQRAGYAKVYRIWQLLKLYLDYFGSDASVSVRSVEKLYEIWCLLEIRNILLSIGFEESKSNNHNLKTVGFEKKMDKIGNTFHLSRPDGMTADLIHEPEYSSRRIEAEKIYSWTTTQRPDIFLEVTHPSGDKVRWIFDAKYRIDFNENKDWPQKGIDTVPDDAINQMHRYRDSLIYISQASEGKENDKSRPIIGAFALYPGWFNQDKSKNPYQESIDAVGIGAFPLVPKQKNRWLSEFIRHQLGDFKNNENYKLKNADDFFVQEPVRIGSSGMKQYRYSELVLAADIYDEKGDDYVIPFKEGSAKWYHIPEKTVNNYLISRHIMREIKYCAFTVNNENGRQCDYIYPVESLHIKARNEINAEAGGPSRRDKNNKNYWLIKLGPSFKSPKSFITKKIHRKFQFRMVPFDEFLKADSWDDLSQKYLKS